MRLELQLKGEPSRQSRFAKDTVADRNVPGVLDEHEQRLLLQIDELLAQGVLIRTKLAQKEVELIEIRRAKAAINVVRPEMERTVAFICSTAVLIKFSAIYLSRSSRHSLEGPFER